MRTEIATALQALNLPPEDLVAVRPNQYRPILNRIFETFTVYGAQGRDRLWLWEGFKDEYYAVHLSEPEDCHWLPRLVPPDERVWLLTEDGDRQKHDGNYWLFEGRVGTIETVIQELFAFEYYVVAKNFQWLLCETHHQMLIGVGSHIIERLRAAESQPHQSTGA
jgi:hypothetical protein